MAASLSLGSDEVRIIGHAINWRLNVPYEHSSPSPLSEQEAETLRSLFNDLCSLNRLCLSGLESVLVEIEESYACGEGRLQLPRRYYRLMTDAVASFFKELRASPTELEVVTGSPSIKTSELLSRLQAI